MMVSRKIIIAFCALFFECNVNAQKTDSLLPDILLKNDNALFRHVLNNKDSFRLQIIYTQINRDKHNKPSFTGYCFNVDADLYFNPASTVKLPLAFLSLEKLNDEKIKGVDKYTAMQFDSSYEGQVKCFTDSTSQTNYPSVAQYIKKAFLVSDNDAYNRMYEFVGQQTINEKLHEKGYSNTRITRQFMGFTEEQNRHTNQIRFIHNDGNLIYTQPAAYSKFSFDFSKTIKLGNGHWNENDSLINEPIDFSRANNLPLQDLQQLLQSVLFPQSVPKQQRFNLTGNDYKFLYRYLSQYPSETNYPYYDTAHYYDSYVKFFFKNGSHNMPVNVRVFNKVGWAYGFLTDVSYIADFKNNVEFMLAATIYVNSDGILNDNKYDYENVGWPFLYELGKTLYQYELQRTRSVKPDLSGFKIEYEKRNAGDKRKAVKEVDN